MGNTYSPLLWDCREKGCFNHLKRPRWEELAGCFPGNISVGDVDGAVEVNAHLLNLEWKPTTGQLSRGQHIMATRLTLGGIISVLVIRGECKTMQVDEFGWYFNGVFVGWRSATKGIEDLKQNIMDWVNWATTHEVVFPVLTTTPVFVKSSVDLLQENTHKI